MPTVDQLLDMAIDVIFSPSLWLGIATALVCSVLFAIWRGGGLRQWSQDAVAGLAGFALGQYGGSWLQLDWQQVGQVHLLWGIAGALAMMLLARRFWRPGHGLPP